MSSPAYGYRVPKQHIRDTEEEDEVEEDLTDEDYIDDEDLEAEDDAWAERDPASFASGYGGEPKLVTSPVYVLSNAP